MKRQEYGKSPVNQEYHTWLSRLANIYAHREHRTNRRSGCESVRLSEKLRWEHVGVNAQPKVWRGKADKGKGYAGQSVRPRTTLAGRVADPL
jgi:hypothetical protein